jgi:4-hydroxy-tetrahydrodipicolinate reductase
MLGEDYDIEIVEEHHRFKKDAPSGSALSLAQSICKATGRPYPDSLIHGRSGKDALRKKGEIGMHAIRAGDITGVHTVIYSTLGETITLNHTAHSRDTLVRGALRAAEWLQGKPAALYSMADVLGIK